MARFLPKIAAVHDLSGFGRASLSVVIPICSTLGIQVCSLPTAVLSTHTEFNNFRFVDLGMHMLDFVKHWEELQLTFDAVYSGFLGSPLQTDVVAECIRACLKPSGIVVIDPVFGDNGELYPTMDMEMVERMRLLVKKATCITPNLTEAAFLLQKSCSKQSLVKSHTDATLKEWLQGLTDFGPESAVITGVPVNGSANTHAVVAFEKSKKTFWRVEYTHIPAYYPGTGDMFASVLTGALVQGNSLPLAIDRAVQFVSLGIQDAFNNNTPHVEGVFLEGLLSSLNDPAFKTNCFCWE